MGQHKVRRRRRSAYLADLGAETRLGLTVSMIMAAIYCAYVIGLFLLCGPGPFDRHGVTLGAMLATYVAGGLACGLLYGALHPLGRSLVGSMLLGVACVTAVFSALCVAMYGLPAAWGEREWTLLRWFGVGFGVVLGPVVRWKWRVSG